MIYRNKAQAAVAFVKRLTPRGKLTLVALVAFVLVVGWFLYQRAGDTLHAGKVDKKDAALETQIQQDLTQGEVHGANANTARDKRQVFEVQHDQATQRRAAAGVESSQAAERQRAAELQYETTTNSNLSDPRYQRVLTDDELCARLAKRDPPIACR